MMLASANAANYELAEPPTVCSRTEAVMSGTVVEKTLCYVNQKTTGDDAPKNCEANSMRLYQPNSSPEANSTLHAFSNSLDLKGEKPDVYVDGRDGNKCQVIRVNEGLKQTPCKFSHNYICEFFDPIVFCDTAGVANPTGCPYKNPILIRNKILRVSSDAAKESIVTLDIQHVAGSGFLPVDLSTSFPNLQLLLAEGSGITEITRRSIAGLTKINFIDLDYNQITAIRSEVFAGLTSLRRLDLGENDQGTLHSLWSLPWNDLSLPFTDELKNRKSLSR
jgi:hypothetical protein